jgi:hypothetical protein
MGNHCSGDRGPKYEGAPDALVKLCNNPTAPKKAEVEALIKLGIDLRHQVGEGSFRFAGPAGRHVRCVGGRGGARAGLAAKYGRAALTCSTLTRHIIPKISYNTPLFTDSNAITCTLYILHVVL